jgi:hypothetical protein
VVYLEYNPGRDNQTWKKVKRDHGGALEEWDNNKWQPYQRDSIVKHTGPFLNINIFLDAYGYWVIPKINSHKWVCARFCNQRFEILNNKKEWVYYDNPKIIPLIDFYFNECINMKSNRFPTEIPKILDMKPSENKVGKLLDKSMYMPHRFIELWCRDIEVWFNFVPKVEDKWWITRLDKDNREFVTIDKDKKLGILPRTSLDYGANKAIADKKGVSVHLINKYPIITPRETYIFPYFGKCGSLLQIMESLEKNTCKYIEFTLFLVDMNHNGTWHIGEPKANKIQDAFFCTKFKNETLGLYNAVGNKYYRLYPFPGEGKGNTNSEFHFEKILRETFLDECVLQDFSELMKRV